MKWLNNINPFYWKRKAESLQAHLDNVAEVRLRQEQKLVELTEKWQNTVKERDAFRAKVPDYTLAEYGDLAQYIAGGATPREAKLLIDVKILSEQVHELGTVLGGKDRFELIKKIHRLECELDKEKALNAKWFKTVVGFEPFQGILMNQSLRGKDLMLDPIIAKLNEVANERDDDNHA